MSRILVVEDELPVRLFLREALGMAGHQVVTAANGVEGLRRLLDEEQGVDLVLSDVCMPEMGGKQFVELLREKGLVLPVLMLTATPHAVLELWEAGKVQGVLKKPVDLTELQDEVALALQLRLDRRSTPRLSWPLPVRVLSHDGVEIHGLIADISPGGVRVNWEDPIDVETISDFEQILVDDPRLGEIQLPVMPAHSLDQPQTGFTFHLRTREEINRLGQLLSHIS